MTDYLTFNGKANIVDLDTHIALEVAKLRAAYSSLRTPDAIHLATALEAKCSHFFTFDRRLPKKIGKLTVVYMEDISRN